MTVLNSAPSTIYTSTATITASGNSGLLNVAGFQVCWLSVFVAGSISGTTPTLDVYYDQQDVAGNLLTQLVHATQLTSSVTQSAVTFGRDVGSLTNVGVPIVIAGTGRVQWVIGGTATPTFTTTTISLIGR